MISYVLIARVHLAFCLCPKIHFERQPVTREPSHYSYRTAELQILPLAQIAFHRPGQEHRCAIWFGGNMTIMFRKTEAEASTVGCSLGKQELSRGTGKLRDYKTTTL